MATHPARIRSIPVAILAACGCGVVLGVLAVASDAVPGVLGRILLLLASTGLTWGAAALALGASSSRRVFAAVSGGLVMVVAVASYYGGAVWTGARVPSGDVYRAAAVWGALGVIAGPALGVLGWHAVRATGPRRSATWGVIAGLLLSQGLYLLYRSRGSLLSAEARPLWLLLIGSLLVPIVIVVVGSRREHIGVGLAVSAVVGTVGALAWVVMLRLVTPF